MKRGALLAALAGIGALILVELVLLSWRADRIPLIRDQGSAQWIRLGTPVDLAAQPVGKRDTGFVLELNVVQKPASLKLRVSALRSATIYLGERQIAAMAPQEIALSEADIDLAPHLEAGRTRLMIVASNERGPPLLRIESEIGGLRSGPDWLASADGRTWVPARPAAIVEGSRLAEEFPSPARSLIDAWPALAAGAAIGLLALWVAPRLLRDKPAGASLRLYRWLLLAGLAVLFVHNFPLVPAHIGMDLDAHLEYLDFIRTRGTLPLGNQGWQMFQPPLAYLFLAGLTALAPAIGLAVDPAYLGRALTMAVSLAAVWAGCRVVELSFRHRPAAAFAGLTLVATLPVVIYMGHAFGNEPFVALFCALGLHRFALMQEASRLQPARDASILGAILGLGVLAKTSALILLLALAPALWCQFRSSGVDRRAALRAVGLYILVAAVVAGWWFARNLAELGRPFVGGWEEGRGIDWWQHPGYRLWEHLWSFGFALARPIFSGVVGFWDGIYSSLWGDGYLSGAILRSYAPTWNYEAMVALYLLAVPVSLAIVAGAGRALAAPAGSGMPVLARLGAVLLVLYVGAAFHLYATVPIYSSAKGSYLLLLSPCLGILFAAGVEPLLARRGARSAAAALLGAWTATVGFAFLAQGAP